MNKQELIKEFEEIGIHGLNMFGTVVKGIPTETAIDLIKQLDEPEKVKVPQFVDDVIEGAREHSPELEDALHYAWSNGSQEFTEWYQKKSNRDLFARAWLDGYKVEEDKRYLVKVKGMNRINGCLAYNKELGTWYFGISGNSKNHSTNHTRKQLEEAGFGWVFDCPGIEIEEVEV